MASRLGPCIATTTNHQQDCEIHHFVLLVVYWLNVKERGLSAARTEGLFVVLVLVLTSPEVVYDIMSCLLMAFCISHNQGQVIRFL